MSKLVKQLAKFISVGVLATGLHVATALGLNQFVGVEALRSNFVAFGVATLWSYLGNWAWTFGGQDRLKSSAPKFLAMSSIAFALNQAIVYWVTRVEGQPLAVAMIPVVVVIPAFSFWLARTHIFRAHQTA
jgi:putative flippase GtrA